MPTASETRGPQLAGPLYLDTSALAKLYVRERESDALNAVLRTRRDIWVSDLSVTETVSSLVRRRREGGIAAEFVARLHQTLLGHIDSGVYRRVELLPPVYREAERLLLALDTARLRAADALHLALALEARAASVLTYDRRMAEAATLLGLSPYPPV